jgi:16S rRNA (guanine1516-N2)-methyltransferase
MLLLFGCTVISSERHPIPALMLLRAYEAFDDELKKNWELDLSGADRSEEVEVIYFDPMYNGPTGSALPRKEMRIFREVVGGDEDAERVAIALREKKRRLIIKRPPKIPPLLPGPSFQQEGKAVRFDVYLPLI